MNRTENIVTRFNRIDFKVRYAGKLVSYVSVAGLLLVMLIAFIDVCGAKFFNRGLKGSTELIAQLNVVLVFLAAPFTQLDMGFTNIELLQKRMPRSVRTVIRIVGSLLGAVLTFLIGYRSIQLLTRAFKLGSKTISGSWGVVLWPFILSLVIGFFIICFTFLWTIAREIITKPLEKKNDA